MEITVLGGKKKITEAVNNRSLLQILQDNSIPVSAPCGGRGTCGKCSVEIQEGKRKKTVLSCRYFPEENSVLKVTVPKEAGFEIVTWHKETNIKIRNGYSIEKVYLEKEKLKTGKSYFSILAESSKKKYDFSIETIRQISNFPMEKTVSENKPLFLLIKKQTVLGISTVNNIPVYGIAVDIGTTTIAMRIFSLLTGKPAGCWTGLNSQRAFGADVIGRIRASEEGNLEKLTDAVRKDILSGIHHLCRKTGIEEKSILEVTAAGNMTMLHLFLGLPCSSIGQYPFHTVFCEELKFRGEELFPGKKIKAGITVLPGISAYVGADILSGMLLCGMDRSEKPVLLIDIGTNGEMALGNKDGFLCASTAAGPAFEGGNISCGTGSIPGAISSFYLDNEILGYRTIGGKHPAGICGTGVISLAARAAEKGWIDPSGLLKVPGCFISLGEDAFGKEIRFTQKDIREVQLAKSAIRAGVETLLKESGFKPDDIETVYIAGGFGSRIVIRDVFRIGMLPECFAGKIEIAGNASLGGASMLLLNPDYLKQLDEMKNKCRDTDLSVSAHFNDLFVEYMGF